MMDASQDFKSVQENIQSSLVATTRSVNELAKEDLSFQRTVHPAVSSKLDAASDRLLRLAGDVLKSAGKFSGQAASELEDVDDVDVGWRGIVDVIDSLLEKADTCLDEYTGLVKRKDTPSAESGRMPKKPKTNDKLDWSLKRANILKPQNAFERKTDNFDTGPWKPLLTGKPHAVVPLEKSLVTFADQDNSLQYTHPYETEIRQMKYPGRVFQTAEAIVYNPIESSRAVWVDTYDQVIQMLGELKKAKEIAVDLEHHDFRSFPGLLSLMQISTREKDWVVDTLVPWRHRLEILNEVFADPSIVKVFHGAYMDIIWLQRDLGLYIVGLFDTHYACEALGYPGRSLAYLLKRFADFDADKKYQMADWRIRPLPEEMLYYARSDTHYLLYIYDMVRNELVERSDSNDPEQDLTGYVVQKSKDVSLQRYETPTCDSETGRGPRGWFNTLVKSPALLSSEQFAVYKAVHKWRDHLARRLDESTHFIMSQHVLADIARIMPADPKALWSLLQKDARTAKSHLDELLAVIKEAKARGATGPSMMDFFRRSSGAIPAKKGGPRGPQSQKGGPSEDVPSLDELRSDMSQLWGRVPLSSVWDGGSRRRPDAPGAPEMAVPWAAYAQGGATVDVVTSERSEQVEGGQEEAAAPPDAKEKKKGKQRAEKVVAPEDEVFTLKAGRKRARAEATAGSDSESGSDAVATSGPSDRAKEDSEEAETRDGAADDKAERKREKKRFKEARKAERWAEKAARKEVRKAAKAAAKQAAAEGEEQDDDEEEPFDYSRAQSVLHAQRANDGSSRPARPSKVFDPYATKTEAAPKGARNMNYHKAGKTATFKK